MTVYPGQEKKLWLPEIEEDFYKQVGYARRIEAIKNGQKQTHLASDDAELALWRDLLGAGGEYVIARRNNWSWGKGNIGDPDVGGCVDVRATEHKDGHLVIQKKDPPDRIFFLVCCYDEGFDLVGWMFARDAKKDEYWRTNIRSPAYLAPRTDPNFNSIWTPLPRDYPAPIFYDWNEYWSNPFETTCCNGLPCETVMHWCPECDFPRHCLIISPHMIECMECFEPIEPQLNEPV